MAQANAKNSEGIIKNTGGQLPDEQREVIVLRHFGNLTFKEIAELTSTSINTALGRMRYGLINLRKMLADKQTTTQDEVHQETQAPPAEHLD